MKSASSFRRISAAVVPTSATAGRPCLRASSKRDLDVRRTPARRNPKGDIVRPGMGEELPEEDDLRSHVVRNDADACGLHGEGDGWKDRAPRRRHHAIEGEVVGIRDRSRPAAEKERQQAAFALTLYDAGRFAEAQALYERLSASHGDSITFAGPAWHSGCQARRSCERRETVTRSVRERCSSRDVAPVAGASEMAVRAICQRCVCLPAVIGLLPPEGIVLGSTPA